jgi:hypothetical protein
VVSQGPALPALMFTNDTPGAWLSLLQGSLSVDLLAECAVDVPMASQQNNRRLCLPSPLYTCAILCFVPPGICQGWWLKFTS